MASFGGSGFDELIEQMKKQSDLMDTAAAEVLEAGAEVLVKSWQDAIKQYGLIDTGDMLNSVAPTKAVVTTGFKYIEVYPQGVDRKGVRNATKAFVNHYGRGNRQATHFVDTAEKNAAGPAVEAMAEVWAKKLEG